MIRGMIKGKGLPHKFECKDVSTTAYILNKCPTSKKPSTSHVKTFWDLCYKQVRYQKGKKLQDKSEPMVLIGYHPIGDYKSYDPLKRKVVISRDLKVDESKTWNLKQKTECGKQQASSFPSSLLDEWKNSEKADKSEDQLTSTRPQWARQVPRHLQDCEMYLDDVVIESGDLIHFALFGNIGPLNIEVSKKEKA